MVELEAEWLFKGSIVGFRLRVAAVWHKPFAIERYQLVTSAVHVASFSCEVKPGQISNIFVS